MWSVFIPIPNLIRRTLSSLGVKVARTLVVVSLKFEWIAASIGKIIGPSFSREDIPQVVKNILDIFVTSRIDTESFLNCFRRLGIDHFRDQIYSSDKDK